MAKGRTRCNICGKELDEYTEKEHVGISGMAVSTTAKPLISICVGSASIRSSRRLRMNAELI